MITLKTALATYGHTKALKDGSVKTALATLEFEEFSPQSAAFKKMVPVAELDLVEMVWQHFLMARDHGKRFTAIPVFPVRQFHHSAITYNATTGVTSPKDLEGKRVGVRTYGFSRSFWLRSVLARDHGVDISRVTWVVNEPEALDEFKLPPNVEVTSGDLSKMLQAGELAAGIGVAGGGSADIKPLFERPGELEAEWFKRTGVYPMSHVLVLRSELTEQHPDLAADLYRAFAEAKRQFVAQLDGPGELDAGDKATAAARAVVGPDPLPYGMVANRATIQMVVEEGARQGFTSKQFSVDELFAPSTLHLP